MAITVPRVVQNINGTATPVPLVPQTVSYTTNSFSADTTQTQFPLQLGVPIQSLYTFNICPASDNNTCIAQAQTVSADTPMVLNTSAQVDPNVGVNPYLSVPFTFSGQNCVMLDCERIPSVTFVGQTTTAATLVLSGFDYRGVAVQSQQTYGAGTTSGSYIVGEKPMSLISSAVWQENPGVEVSLGNSDYIGLPYFIFNAQAAVTGWWNEIQLTQAQLVSELFFGNIWRITAPSATSGAARGYFATPTAANNRAFLTLQYLVYGADSEFNNLLQNLQPSALFYLGCERNASNQYTWPYLTQYDLVGMQYPGDNAAYQAYTQALAI